MSKRSTEGPIVGVLRQTVPTTSWTNGSEKIFTGATSAKLASQLPPAPSRNTNTFTPFECCGGDSGPAASLRAVLNGFPQEK